jgi:hypothetical protein
MSDSGLIDINSHYHYHPSLVNSYARFFSNDFSIDEAGVQTFAQERRGFGAALADPLSTPRGTFYI